MGRPSVCIVTIFRNEANAICEWATHHIQQGVSRLFMIDHNSTDRWQEEVSPALRQHMTVVYEPRSSASEDKPVQVPLLTQHFLRAARAYTWVMGVDLDEFVFARGSHAGSIPSALAAVPWWRPGVRLTSKRFGSAGLREQPRCVPHPHCVCASQSPPLTPPVSSLRLRLPPPLHSHALPQVDGGGLPAPVQPQRQERALRHPHEGLC